MATSKGSSAEHSALVDATMLTVGSLPFVRCWKQVVGLFYQVRFDPKTRKVIAAVPVTVGTEGMGDLGAIVTRWDGVGVHAEIELKTGQAKQSPEQIAREKMIRSRGGIYLLARSDEEALELLERERVRGKP